MRGKQWPILLSCGTVTKGMKYVVDANFSARAKILSFVKWFRIMDYGYTVLLEVQ